MDSQEAWSCWVFDIPVCVYVYIHMYVLWYMNIYEVQSTAKKTINSSIHFWSWHIFHIFMCKLRVNLQQDDQVTSRTEESLWTWESLEFFSWTIDNLLTSSSHPFPLNIWPLDGLLDWTLWENDWTFSDWSGHKHTKQKLCVPRSSRNLLKVRCVSSTFGMIHRCSYRYVLYVSSHLLLHLTAVSFSRF